MSRYRMIAIIISAVTEYNAERLLQNEICTYLKNKKRTLKRFSCHFFLLHSVVNSFEGVASFQLHFNNNAFY